MISARIFIFIISICEEIYDVFISYIADKHRQKPLPKEVADIYDKERYQTYLAFVADKKKLKNKYSIINFIISTIIIFSPLYEYIDKFTKHNAYLSFLAIYFIIWIICFIISTFSSYEKTFGLLEKYKMNKKDKKEFIKDLIINNVFSIIIVVGAGELLTFIGEHIPLWTNHFTIGYTKAFIICLFIFGLLFLFSSILKLISYLVLKKQYKFEPLQDGELKDKINKLQASSKKKVKHIYIYNESKKTTTKNAFLLTLFWHREFGIADNFINENAEDELLAVLSHEIGHLKHKKDIFDFIGYALNVLSFVLAVYLLVNPSIVLAINKWIRISFNIVGNNYYLFALVYGSIYNPISFLIDLLAAYSSRRNEYSADLEAVNNGYGEALIKTFKTLSSDELVNVYPHPLIEFIEYDHPGMYQRIKAIHKAEENLKKNDTMHLPSNN